MKRFLLTLPLSALIALLIGVAQAQDVPAPTPGTTSSGDQGSTGAAPAATGPEPGTGPSENPPLSGLDAPSFEPGFGARSYLASQFQLNEAVDTNRVGAVGNKSAVGTVTRGLAAFDLQKLWKVHPLNIDYAGGVSWYPGQISNGSSGTTTNAIYQMHSLSAIQRFLWRTGQLALRDGFSYLPQGSFGSNSFGGSGAFSGGNVGGVGGGGGVVGGGGGSTNLPGVTSFGNLFNQSRIMNTAIVDVTEELSPRSSVVASGGFGWTDFLNNPTGYVNSHQTTGQIGYNYQLTRKDQVAIDYAYQDFRFPQQGGGHFTANVWQVMYGHRISGRLNLVLSGGPQWAHVYRPQTSVQGANTSYISGVGRVTVSYNQSARTNFNLDYSHFANPGSGFLSGANTDFATLAMNHSLTRRWRMTADGGYSYSSRVIAVSNSVAHNASSYTYWYGGATLHRQVSRQVGAFASYQYDAIGFNSGFCVTTACSLSNRSYGRQTGVIGLDWTPAPMRLD